MNLAADPINILEPQFMDLGISTIGVLDKGASIFIPNTRVGKPTDVPHWSAPNHIFGKAIAFGDAVIEKSDYNY